MRITPRQLLRNKHCCVCSSRATPKQLEYLGEDNNVYVVCAYHIINHWSPGRSRVGRESDCLEKFCMFPFTWLPDTELTELATTIRNGLECDVGTMRKAVSYINDNACCPVNIPKHYTPKQQLKRLKQLEKKMKSLCYTGVRKDVGK